jgi:DnaK suppressor protein
MESEWTPGRHDENDGGADMPVPSFGTDGAAMTPDADHGLDVVAPVASAVDAEPPTWPGDEAASTADAEVGDAREGEVEAHRSAVDAVDELLDEVELALARLDDGTYGRCESCGVPIDDADLAVQPLVRECAGCSTRVLATESV